MAAGNKISLGGLLASDRCVVPLFLFRFSYNRFVICWRRCFNLVQDTFIVPSFNDAPIPPSGHYSLTVPTGNYKRKMNEQNGTCLKPR